MRALPTPPTDDENEDKSAGVHKYKDAQEAARIYFLPNLFTAGNLFFGFIAIIRCIQARYGAEVDANALYTEAVWCILFAGFCDALDGRLARLGGRESLFGKEFDSIADTVSFGVAPALMVFFLILGPSSEEYGRLFQDVGWLVGFIYLLCVAVRLARFNVLTSPLLPGVSSSASTKDFMGLPSPAAAGFVASLVLVMLHLDFEKATIRHLSILLLPLLLLVALLMVSNIPYPSFKTFDWQLQTKTRPFIIVITAIAIVGILLKQNSFAVFFLCYIFFGLFRYARRAWVKRRARPANSSQAPFPPAEEEDEDAF